MTETVSTILLGVIAILLVVLVSIARVMADYLGLLLDVTAYDAGLIEETDAVDDDIDLEQRVLDALEKRK